MSSLRRNLDHLNNKKLVLKVWQGYDGSYISYCVILMQWPQQSFLDDKIHSTATRDKKKKLNRNQIYFNCECQAFFMNKRTWKKLFTSNLYFNMVLPFHERTSASVYTSHTIVYYLFIFHVSSSFINSNSDKKCYSL